MRVDRRLPVQMPDQYNSRWSELIRWVVNASRRFSQRGSISLMFDRAEKNSGGRDRVLLPPQIGKVQPALFWKAIPPKPGRVYVMCSIADARRDSVDLVVKVYGFDQFGDEIRYLQDRGTENRIPTYISQPYLTGAYPQTPPSRTRLYAPPAKSIRVVCFKSTDITPSNMLS